MRNGQNKRMRGRNRSKGQNPLTRVYESNGPDVKIRGTASHVADKYVQLARDAQTSGDPVSAENYFQHAEHYLRLIAAAQEQFRQANPYYRPEQEQRGDDFGDDGDDEGGEQPNVSGAPSSDQPFGTAEPQPFLPREAQPFPPRDQSYGGRDQRQHGGRPQQQAEQPQPQPQADAERLPAFITGGQQAEGYQGHRPANGFEGQPDRFPLHRRRRRHRGPRGDQPGAPTMSEGGADGE
jgi:Domain of unknown function (DUF4167)